MPFVSLIDLCTVSLGVIFQQFWECKDGTVVRALASLQCGLGSISRPGVMWVEFAVGFCPCCDGFSPGSLVFLPPQKPTLQILIRSVHLIITSC